MSIPTPTHITQMIAKAWKDPAFKNLMETDPTAAITQFALDNGHTYTKLLEIPPPPADLSNSDITKIANGTAGLPHSHNFGGSFVLC